MTQKRRFLTAAKRPDVALAPPIVLHLCPFHLLTDGHLNERPGVIQVHDFRTDPCARNGVLSQFRKSAVLTNDTCSIGETRTVSYRAAGSRQPATPALGSAAQPRGATSSADSAARSGDAVGCCQSSSAAISKRIALFLSAFPMFIPSLSW